MRSLWVAAVLAVSSTAWAQGPSVEPAKLSCLPLEANSGVTATVAAGPSGSSVRLYFRRLNPLGAFYYNRMFPAGGGAYWSVFPRPEKRPQAELTDEWWQELRNRDWMDGRDRAWLESWLEGQQHEAAEYYVGVYDSNGEPLSRSRIRLVAVVDEPDCPTDLGPHERGWSWNLTVGESTELQLGRPVFHWLCDGIVTRIGWDGIVRADEICRVCVLGGGYPSSSRSDRQEAGGSEEE